MSAKAPFRIAAAVAFAATASVLTAAGASAQDPLPIGPNQYFTAQVNGVSANAVVKVVCPGPVGTAGHPIAGQSVEVDEVYPPISAAYGYTGTLARQIDAQFSPITGAVQPPVVLSGYFVKYAIPTTLTLPCGGRGVVTFMPYPTSPSAHSFTVSVSYANIAVTP